VGGGGGGDGGDGDALTRLCAEAEDAAGEGAARLDGSAQAAPAREDYDFFGDGARRAARWAGAVSGGR
jgi:hypothetical protein